MMSFGADMTAIVRLMMSLGADMITIARLTMSLGASHTDSEATISRLTINLEPYLLSTWIKEIFLELSEPDG